METARAANPTHKGVRGELGGCLANAHMPTVAAVLSAVADSSVAFATWRLATWRLALWRLASGSIAGGRAPASPTPAPEIQPVRDPLPQWGLAGDCAPTWPMLCAMHVAPSFVGTMPTSRKAHCPASAAWRRGPRRVGQAPRRTHCTSCALPLDAALACVGKTDHRKRNCDSDSCGHGVWKCAKPWAPPTHAGG